MVACLYSTNEWELLWPFPMQIPSLISAKYHWLYPPRNSIQVLSVAYGHQMTFQATSLRDRFIFILVSKMEDTHRENQLPCLQIFYKTALRLADICWCIKDFTVDLNPIHQIITVSLFKTENWSSEWWPGLPVACPLYGELQQPYFREWGQTAKLAGKEWSRIKAGGPTNHNLGHPAPKCDVDAQQRRGLSIIQLTSLCLKYLPLTRKVQKACKDIRFTVPPTI
jgi:hypothetical protein